MNGTVNANNASTVVTFHYGLTTAYGMTAPATQSPATGNTGIAASKTITGLTPNTTYHYQVVAVNAAGTTYGGDMTFTTSPVPVSPPSSTTSTYSPPAPVTQINNGGSTTGSNLDQLVSAGKTLTVDGEKGAKLVFDTTALRGIDGQTSGEIKVEMKDVSPTHQENLPGKLVFSLTVSSGSNTISDFGGSVTITLPYELKDGETAEDVTVWFLANDGTMTEIPCTYDPATKLATFTVTHFSLYVVGVPGVESWTNPYADVRTNDWFYNAVSFVSYNGLMKGVHGTSFSPSATVTRGMFVTMLWRMEKEPPATQSASFTDVSDSQWYAKAVAWATNNQIVTGYAGRFSPDAPLTREQMAAILYRYAACKHRNTSGTGDLSTFTDQPSAWARTSMAWAVAEGLIQGDGERLDPCGGATRAQAATVLHKYMTNAGK